MKRRFPSILLLLLSVPLTASLAAGEDRNPPWLEPPGPGKQFTVPEVDNVPDLHGDVNDPQLVIFFSGNQFMVTHDLVDAFRSRYPEYKRIYFQTIPPGIALEQIEQGALIMGNLRITLRPDVVTAGRERIDQLQNEKNWFRKTVDYARNRLAIMVADDNPENVRGWSDLARKDVTVAMPNPEWEAITQKIEEAMRSAGGDDLVRQVMEKKKAAGTTLLTSIHHRQTPLWIMNKKADAGPVWITEVLFQKRIGHPIGLVGVPEEHNVVSTYTAASMHQAPHPEAAERFLDFISSETAQQIYREYGFLPPG